MTRRESHATLDEGAVSGKALVLLGRDTPMRGWAAATIAFCLAALGAADAARAGAQTFQLAVDARNQCLNVNVGRLDRVATMFIPNGRYTVTVTSTARYRPSGAGDAVHKVAFFITTFNQPTGWFFAPAVGMQSKLEVRGPGGVGASANTIRAFFIDSYCSDNTGRATITFSRVGD
jgi:hypothetical protein